MRANSALWLRGLDSLEGIEISLTLPIQAYSSAKLPATYIIVLMVLIQRSQERATFVENIQIRTF